jgi:predicted small lipoprotein YifL
MNHTLYTRLFLAAALLLTAPACGQKGPLIAPPEAPAPRESPAPEAAATDPAMTDEADD